MVEIAGWTGAVLILLAYMLLSMGRLTGQSALYQGMNMVGAAGFVVNGWWHGALPSATLNVDLDADRSVGAMADPYGEARLVDLSHLIEHGMVTYQGPAGAAYLRLIGRARARPRNYDDGSSFQIGRIDMVANTGTYLDAPFHRYADGADLAGARRWSSSPRCPASASAREAQAVDADAFEGLDVAGKAVLVHTGWDRHWRTDAYGKGHPFLTEAAARLLVERGARLVGIDSYNIDDTGAPRPPGPHHPARRGRADLRAYDQSRRAARRSGFAFTAVPPKIAGMGTFPVRAFAADRRLAGLLFPALARGVARVAQRLALFVGGDPAAFILFGPDRRLVGPGRLVRRGLVASACRAARFSACAASRASAASRRAASVASSTAGLALSRSSAFCFASAARPTRSW